MLSVRSVDLLSSKTGQNRLEHHTNLYHGNELIIRRGQTFQIELDLSRPFNSNTDKLHLDLKTGKSDLDVCHKKAIVLYSLVQYALCIQHYIIQCGVVGHMCPAVSQAPRNREGTQAEAAVTHENCSHYSHCLHTLAQTRTHTQARTHAHTQKPQPNMHNPSPKTHS